MKTSRMWMGLSLAAMMATGCADNQEALIILHAARWETPGDCLVDGANDVALSNGVLDVALGTPYEMPLILLNQLQSQTAMMENNQIDNGELQLTGADVVLTMPQAPDVIDRVAQANESNVDFAVDLSTISLGAGERQGFLIPIVSQPASTAFADAIRAELTTESRPTLVATTVFRARRTGNRVGKVGEIESRAFSFPVELCLGCLYTCASCSDQARVDQCGMDRQAVIEGTSTIVPAGGICGNAQDFAIAPGYCGDPNGE